VNRQQVGHLRVRPGLAKASIVVLGGVLVGLVAVPLLLFAWAFGGCLLPRGDSFDARTWQSADPYSACSARYEMVDDLLANHLTVGMTRTEVMGLLGGAASEDELAMAGSRPGDLVYGTGCEIDCFWLVVEFGPDNQLTVARRYHD
jgi:hypothetical protein